MGHAAGFTVYNNITVQYSSGMSLNARSHCSPVGLFTVDV